MSVRSMLLVTVATMAAASVGAQTSGGQAPASPASGTPAADPLAAGFQNPGDEARPRVWWHWMNGNVTEDGVRADIAWMKRTGIAGMQAFDAGRATPQLVDERLPYMSPGWKKAFATAAELAERNGMELGTAASPGWSQTGGPWVKPEDGMKKYVWSETVVQGGRPFAGRLAAPPTTTGVFQTSKGGGVLGGRRAGEEPPEFYRDTKVIAFRVDPSTDLPKPRITSSGGTLDTAALSDGDLEKVAIALPQAAAVGGESWIQFDYGRPVTVRGLAVSTGLNAVFYDALRPAIRSGLPPLKFRLEASDDARNWRDTGAVIQTGQPQRTSDVDNVRARYFRFVNIRQAEAEPRPTLRFQRPQSPVPATLNLRELTLTGAPVIASFEEKAAFYNNAAYYQLPSGTRAAGVSARTANVIDITDRMQPDGTLTWTPPAGTWKVLRFGWSLTGSHNSPASPEATGLEVDKLDAAAVKRYLDHYLGMYRDASGGRMGAKGLHAIMLDSWEASNQNWSAAILEDFRRLRGYDPVPWMPVLAGYVVESPEKSDGFLFDFRRTIGEVLKENHHAQITRVLHDLGMIRYGEGHEELFVVPGDGMEMKQSADIPMGAMWQVTTPGTIEPVYYNDLQESASVAHIYGQNIAAAEALTGGPPFGSAPWDLKPTADAIMLAGVNRFVIHTSAHQPIGRGPGTTLGVGQYFTRNETWADQAKTWVDYLSRASFLLQQGRAANDVAVFYGEAAPVIAAYRDTYPQVPQGYRYDYVNADVILNRLAVRDGAMSTDTGMRYRLLLLGNNTERVTLPVLRKMRDMVREGATLAGVRPQGSPSLADDPAEVKRVLDELWPGGSSAQVGRGRVFATANAAEPLKTVGVEPDFTYSAANPDAEVMFMHRRLNDGDVYFLSNRRDRYETLAASFRTTAGVPELWDAATGRSRPAAYQVQGDHTVVTVPLDRFGSTFVVFRGGTGASSRVLPVERETELTTLAGPWSVSFQADRGAPARATFDQLGDLTANADPGIRYFSGVASYARNLRVPADWTRGGPVWLDLGTVFDLAEVRVNGQLVGTAWKPPYRVDVSQALRRGRNRIEVKAVNLWVNRLIGDVQPGVTRKITFTAADGKVAPGTSPEAAARQLAMPYRADAPLRPSGLLGPVRLIRIDMAPAPNEAGR